MEQRSRIYEQVSGADPGDPFRPSGLFRHVGDVIAGRFRGVQPSGLRTEAEWLRVYATSPAPVQRQQPPRPPALPPRNVWQEITDMAADYLPRRAQARRATVDQGAVWPDVPAAPRDMLGAVVRLQREQGLRT